MEMNKVRSALNEYVRQEVRQTAAYLGSSYLQADSVQRSSLFAVFVGWLAPNIQD
jgi:hypothetical protein